MKDKGSVSLGSASSASGISHEGNQITEDEKAEDDMDFSDICEVVLSLKCKKCDFLCNDKTTLSDHIKVAHLHVKPKGNGKNKKCNGLPSSSLAKEINIHQQQTKRRNDRSCNSSKTSSEEISEGKTTTTSSTKKRQSAKVRKTSNESSNAQEPVSRPSKQKVNTRTGEDNNGTGDDNVEDVFLCAECDIVFSSRETCCSHMHKVHGLKQFSADFIQEEIISKPNDEDPKIKRKPNLPMKFTKESGTIVPKKYRVTKEIFHTCTKCTIKFENVDVMRFHEKCHLVVPDFSDTGADRRRGNEEESGEEIAAETTQKGFFCPVCECNSKREAGGSVQQFFPKWAPCSWHLWKEHRIDCELYTCSVCKQFKSHLITRVKDHEQLHSSKSSYKCKTCNKTFKQLKQLRCHEKYHKDYSTKLAPEIDSRWYTPKECPICKRILSDSKCLKKHISAVHNKLKPYVCTICGHTSARKQELVLHVRQHTGEKPFKCTICSFQTGDHNSLRKHKLRHSDERPYACSYCDYRCIQSCAFKKHILACHPGQDVVFLCQLCSHQSVNESLFAAHKKDHAEGRITTDIDGSKNKTNECLPPRKSSSENANGGEQLSTNAWSGDDDSSLDIIDNGGVTIPATPPPAQSQNEESISILKMNSPEIGKIKKEPINTVKPITFVRQPVTSQQSHCPSTQPSNFCDPPSSTLSSVATLSASPSNNTLKQELFQQIGSFRKPAETFQPSSPSPIIVLSKEKSYIEKLSVLDSSNMKRIVSSLYANNNGNTIPGQLPIQHGFQLTSASQSSMLSPRFINVSSNNSCNGFTTIASHNNVNAGGSTQQQHQPNHAEDPESSTSEVITNPHQLIQNIQLTPLDLTDIISCSEQSNDDGMLQRLLDMSGV